MPTAARVKAQRRAPLAGARIGPEFESLLGR